MSGIATDRSPSFSLPLRYFLLGIACYVLSLVGAAALGSELLVSSWTPHILALTHLMTLGFILPMIMGATYQLIPVVLLTPLWSERLGKGVFWLYVPGVIGMVAGFWTMWPPLLGVGATCVILAIAVFLGNVAVSMLKGATWSVIAGFVAVAMAFLALAVAAGYMRALAFFAPAYAVPLAHGLETHAHLAVFGCVSLLVFGVSYQLVPMFAVTHGHERLLKPVLASGAIGTLAVATGHLALVPWLTRGGAVLITLAAWLWAYDLWRMYRGRTRKQLDAGLTLFASSVPYLLVATLLGLGLTWGVLPPGVSPDRWRTAYAIIALGGWVTFSITGQYYKIMPFLAWFHRYSSQVGKKGVPLIRNLFSEKLARGGLWVSHLGTVGLVVSVLAGWGIGITLFGALAAVGALAIPVMAAQTLLR